MRPIDIKDFRSKYDLTQEDLSEITCSSIRAVQSWEQGARNITQSAIRLMEYYVDGLTGDGDGDMLKSDNQVLEANSMHQVPVYNIDAVGGYVANQETDTQMYIKDYIPFKGARSEDIAIQVSNDSMFPYYQSGCFVQIRRIEAWLDYLELGKVYVIELEDDRRLIKQIKKGDSKENYTLHSFNEKYDDTSIPIRMIRSVWLVIAQYHRAEL